MNPDYQHLKDLARTYLKARRAFLTQSEKYTDLKGNDSLVGRIGEMIALQFLRSKGRQVQKHLALNHAITDLVVQQASVPDRLVSVKLISAENKAGSTTRLKFPWDEFILIELQADYTVQRLGWLTLEQLQAKGEEALAHKQPITSRRMLNQKGLIGRHGQVYDRQVAQHARFLDDLL